MRGHDPDFLEFFAAEFWPLRRVGFLLTGGWATYTDDAGNLRFRYPLGWRIEQLDQRLRPELLLLVPPDQAAVPQQQRKLTVSLEAAARFWIGEDWFGTTSQGRLPGGQAYLRTSSLPIDPGARMPRASSAVGDQTRDATWSVD